jgi:hypothetical protein
MITISMILSIVLALIVVGILWLIVQKVSVKFGLDQVWIQILGLIILLALVIWAFGLFGVSQPIVRG